MDKVYIEFIQQNILFLALYLTTKFIKKLKAFITCRLAREMTRSKANEAHVFYLCEKHESAKYTTFFPTCQYRRLQVSE